MYAPNASYGGGTAVSFFVHTNIIHDLVKVSVNSSDSLASNNAMVLR